MFLTKKQQASNMFITAFVIITYSLLKNKGEIVMKKLKTLFAKGFMKLTKGREIVVLTPGDLVITEAELRSVIIDSSNKSLQAANERIKYLEEMRGTAYRYGYEAGLRKSSDYTLVLPSAIREENKHLVEIVGLIASELLKQGDLKSCVWLLKKIVGCRSL